MATQEENFTEIFQAITKFLGIADPNYPEGGVIIPNAPYTKKFLLKRLVQADLEVCKVICSLADHPFRNTFFTTPPTAINAGARIPSYLGVHGGVKIKISLPTQTEVWVDGDLAQSFNALKIARQKSKLNKLRFPEHRELYWIENGKIELIRNDLQAKIEVPTLPKQSVVTGSEALKLYTPEEYKNAALANCLTMLRIRNADNTHLNDWAGIWSFFLAEIQGKAMNLPLPERLQRIAG